MLGRGLPWKAWAPFAGILFGPLLIGMGAYNAIGAFASRSWPHVRGVITHSSLVTGSGRDHSKTASIRYAYDYNGRHLENDRIAYGRVSTSGAETAVAAGYSTGDSVDVYLDADNPARSVLQTGGVGVSLGETIVGLLLFSVFVRAAMKELRARKAAPRVS